MTKPEVDPAWERASRAGARRMEAEVMADPQRPYPDGVEYEIRRPGRRDQLFTVRLSAQEHAALQKAAASRHLPASTLARAWLLDRLSADQRAS